MDVKPTPPWRYQASLEKIVLHLLEYGYLAFVFLMRQRRGAPVSQNKTWRCLGLKNQVNDNDEGRYERNRKEKAREYERQRAVGSKISLSASFRLNANGSRHDAQNKLKQSGWTAFRVLI